MRLLDRIIDKRLAERIPKTEQGVTGTKIYGGLVYGQEFNAEWTDIKQFENADKMRRTDAQVNASLLSIELPIRSATFTVEPASDDNKDLEIAEFVEDNLFHNKNFSWNFFIRHVLYHLQFGCYLFEQVYQLEDGKYWLKSFSPRIPKTIQKWHQNPDGSLKEVEQLAIRPGGGYGIFHIPNEYLVVFTHDQEGHNWKGTSILRAAYRNWKIKDMLLRVDAMRHERHGLGVPVITLPAGVKSEDKTAAEEPGET